jgi:hypothetical protein
MPCSDVVSQSDEGASQRPDSWRVLWVLEVAAEAFNVFDSHRMVGVGVDLTDRFFGWPCCCDFVVRVASFEETHEFAGSSEMSGSGDDEEVIGLCQSGGQ